MVTSSGNKWEIIKASHTAEKTKENCIEDFIRMTEISQKYYLMTKNEPDLSFGQFH